MGRAREVGTLWIGGSLSWMEQLCLKSFVDQGQKITLFSYHDIPNVPKGVIRRNGRDIVNTDDFIKYEKKDSFALFADYFRLHMIQQNPGMIWVDTDVYCHRPMTYDSDYVLGFELPKEKRVNNAVIGLPPDSPVLLDMLSFMQDRYAIPPFVKQSLQGEYHAAAANGAPVHVSHQPWGVWGPMMLTHFAHKHGILPKVQPTEAFYPISFPDRLKFLRKSVAVEKGCHRRPQPCTYGPRTSANWGCAMAGCHPSKAIWQTCCTVMGSWPSWRRSRHGVGVCLTRA